MHESPNTLTPLISELAGDPELGELVREFVTALAERVAALERALVAGDLARTAIVAHQLKGAAGGYGFPPISEAARRVEAIGREARDIDALREAVADLAGLCRRAEPPG